MQKIRNTQEDNATDQPGADYKIKEASPQMMVHVDGAVKSLGLPRSTNGKPTRE